MVSLQRSNGLHQHLQASLPHPIHQLLSAHRLAQDPADIALHAQRDVAAALGLLEAVLQLAGVLPLLGRHLRAVDDLAGDAAHRGAVHAERALRDAVFELVQERHAAVIRVDVNLHALGRDLGVAGELCGEGVVVRGEEAGAANVCCDVVEDGLRDCDAVVGRCAAAELIEDDQGARRGFRENFLRLGKLDEEGRLGGEDVVVGAEARHDAVDRRQGC